MKRRHFIGNSGKLLAAAGTVPTLLSTAAVAASPLESQNASNGKKGNKLVILGATPGGICTAIAAARRGLEVVLLERTAHIGGLPANGLGATDIATRGVTGGLFLKFTREILNYYVSTYGAESQQVKDCSNGYHFEPSVAEMIFEKWLSEYPKIQVLKNRQLDVEPSNIEFDENGHIVTLWLLNRTNNTKEEIAGDFFIDATYEGDLLDIANCPWRIGREPKRLHNEPGAGRVYKYWGGEEGQGSTGLGDNAIQAYNYRMCLSDDPANSLKVEKPKNYNREEFLQLADDIHSGRYTSVVMKQVSKEMLDENRRRSKEKNLPPEVPFVNWGQALPKGLRRTFNPVKLPNNKTDSNNQHFNFLSSDLPEENWPWPTSSWEWRDRYAQRLREYTLGLLYFVQNDEAVPKWYKDSVAQWGLSKLEYQDNGFFPRQVYVREGRRLDGIHNFTAHDALPKGNKESRPPVYGTAITSSHYALDSHAVRKEEPNKVHLDGFLSYETKPYTVPAGVMIPRSGPKNILCPVPVSGTHIGFSTLRMEPCWMAMGEAAGEIAAFCLKQGVAPVTANISPVQLNLLQEGAVLYYFKDYPVGEEGNKIAQWLGLKNLLPEWEAKPNDKVIPQVAKNWASALKAKLPKSFENLTNKALWSAWEKEGLLK